MKTVVVCPGRSAVIPTFSNAVHLSIHNGSPPSASSPADRGSFHFCISNGPILYRWPRNSQALRMLTSSLASRDRWAISQLMATLCINQPTLETCVASKIERRSGS